MPSSLLEQEERSALLAFVDRSPPGSAYLQRARILLLADSGNSQEAIAAEVDIPIIRVRQMLRAFNRQRLALFPDDLLSPKLYYPDDPIAETGRQIMGKLLAKLESHLEDLETTTSVVAVHETRKTIRRLFTAFILFDPFYEAGLLTAFRRSFRKFMPRLGRSRDAAVFLIKLDKYINEAVESGTLAASELEPMEALQRYMETRKVTADEKVRRYLAKGKYQTLLADFGRFVHSADVGLRSPTDRVSPTQVRHVAPILIYQKVAAVRAYDNYLEGASVKLLHALRIQIKVLRYTLEFFMPVLGSPVVEAINIVKDMLTYLGDLNDARIHLEMLGKIKDKELAPVVSLYAAAKEAERDRLVDGFPACWEEFDRPAWHLELAIAVAEY